MTDSDAARLEDYRLQMGHDAGNLALALDQLTDALTAVALHGVYYRQEPNMRRNAPPDLAPLAELLRSVKALVQDSLLRLKDREDSQ